MIFAGVLAGDAVLYWAGRHWGELLLDWRVVRRVLSRAREERLKVAYREHGAKIVFTARHMMGFWKFLAVDAAAAVLGISLSFGLAYVFADQVEGVLRDVHRIERWLTLLAVAAVAGWLVIGAYRRSRRP